MRGVDVMLPPISPPASGSGGSNNTTGGGLGNAPEQKFNRVKLVRLWSTLNNQMEKDSNKIKRKPAVVYKYK